jgi:hypothetical protein
MSVYRWCMAGIAQRGPWGVAVCAVLALVLAGCASASSVLERPPESTSPPDQSIIFVIHGDGEYMYRDASGETVNADEVTVARARALASSSPDAEVLIFHERPRRYSLLFFPRADGHFYHYRAGRLIQSDRYRRSGDRRLRAISERVKRLAHHDSDRMLFYFGHEIPEVGGAEYDASYPDRTFTVDDFSAMVSSMAEDRPFDVIALSTCYGGTPYTVASLAPYTRYLIASPDNLHLSYLAVDTLAGAPRAADSAAYRGFLQEYLASSFKQLTNSVHTTVSLALYDMERLRPYVSEVAARNAVARSEASNRRVLAIEHYDCADDESYLSEGMKDGVSLLHRPARFGRSQFVENPSGWMCWRPAD